MKKLIFPLRNFAKASKYNWKTFVERNHFGVIGADRSILLKWTLNTQYVTSWTD